MKIQVIKGDVSDTYKFKREYDDKTVIKTLPQKMWITFKKGVWCKKCLFQKTLENNGIKYSEEDNYYRFRLESDDTCNLDYDTYYFDIAILNEQGEKKTLLNNGELVILTHYTEKNNEV
jgi:hypothetical protein